jgi:hypothetical protein
MDFALTAASTSDCGVTLREVIIFCEISQFWQKRHLKLQPLGPVEKICEPGKK